MGLQQRQQRRTNAAAVGTAGSDQNGSPTSQRPQKYNRADFRLRPSTSQGFEGYGSGASIRDSEIGSNADMVYSRTAGGSGSSVSHLSLYDRFDGHADEVHEPEMEGSLRSSNDSRTRLNPDGQRQLSPLRRDRGARDGQGYGASASLLW